MYCCGFTPKPERPEELKVEGVSLPIVEDANFNKYDDLLASGKKVKATVVETSFSGKRTQYQKNGPTFYAGYGHMGIGSLFVMQKVLDVDATTVENQLSTLG